MNMVPGPMDIETYRMLHEPVYFQGVRLEWDYPTRELTKAEADAMGMEIGRLLHGGKMTWDYESATWVET